MKLVLSCFNFARGVYYILRKPYMVRDLFRAWYWDVMKYQIKWNSPYTYGYMHCVKTLRTTVYNLELNSVRILYDILHAFWWQYIEANNDLPAVQVVHTLNEKLMWWKHFQPYEKYALHIDIYIYVYSLWWRVTAGFPCLAIITTRFRVLWNLDPVSITIPPLPGMGNPMLKMRRSRDRLIFVMGIPMLVRRHLYIETAPRFYFRAFVIIGVFFIRATPKPPSKPYWS